MTYREHMSMGVGQFNSYNDSNSVMAGRETTYHVFSQCNVASFEQLLCSLIVTS